MITSQASASDKVPTLIYRGAHMIREELATNNLLGKHTVRC